jgi:hypothetical protein
VICAHRTEPEDAVLAAAFSELEAFGAASADDRTLLVLRLKKG